MKILIVGGGLGGMALAAFLEQRKLDYTLVERTADGGSQGYSLGVWSNTRALFAGLGLEDAFSRLGTPIHDYQIVNASGRLLTRFSFKRLEQRFGMAYTAVDRTAVHRLLAGVVPVQRKQTGRHVTGMAGRWVQFSDGAAAEYDVVVGADGVHSTVRAAAFGPGCERATGWRAWYARIDKGHVPPNGMIECVGPGRCAALFDDPGQRGLGVFFAARGGSEPSNGREDADALRRLFADQAPIVRAVLAGVVDGDFMPTDLATVSLKQWHRGPVVLLGDAAHAFEPHTGLGASMAMGDAFVLAAVLDDAAAGRVSIAAALADYQRQRRPAVALARRINTQIRALAFIRSPVRRAMVDCVIPWIPHWPFVRQYSSLLSSSGPLAR